MAMFLGYMQGLAFYDEALSLILKNNRHDTSAKDRKSEPMNSARTYAKAERNLMDEIITPRFSYEEKLYGLEE